MRAFISILSMLFVFKSFSMRSIQQPLQVDFRKPEKVCCITIEDRQLIFDRYREVRARTLKNVTIANYNAYDYIRNIGNDISAQCTSVISYLTGKCDAVLPISISRRAVLSLTNSLDILTEKDFEEHVATCMSIPYVRESVTGLAVESFIKRLELACQPATDKTKRNKRKKAMAEQTPDFSVLEAFRDNDFQNVINMNNEWLAHHDDPKYDHGAPMYWFPDLDQALESTIQNVKLQLINIAMMYNYPEQQQNAWNILYTWKEYISSK